VTRTWPVSPKFSEAQIELYDMILSVQKKCIEHCITGISFTDLQILSEKLIFNGLVRLNILENSKKDWVRMKMRYYPHSIGHHLGMDVHDSVHSIRSKNHSIPLEEGMCVTIEPGVYLPQSDTTIPEKYRGIGIRIEDNIFVRPGKSDILTIEIPKEIDDIHYYRNNNNK